MDTPTKPEPTFAVSLPIWKWHKLLGLLEDTQGIIGLGLDRETNYQLYEAIASQLNDHPIVIQRRVLPPTPPLPTALPLAPRVESPTKFWSRLRSRFIS